MNLISCITYVHVFSYSGGLQPIGGDWFIQMLQPATNSTSQPAIPADDPSTSAFPTEKPAFQPITLLKKDNSRTDK